MAFIPVPDTCMAEFIHTLNGETVENTMWFHGTAPWSEALLASLAIELRDWWLAQILTDLSSQMSFQEVRVTDMGDQNGPVVSLPISPVVAGSLATGEALPNNVSCTVTFRTGMRGKSFRGRIYMAGFRSTMLSATNVLSGATRGNWLTGFNALAAAITVNGAEHVVASRYADKQARVTGLATPVTSYSVDTVLDSQRRRLPGRGQ